MQVPGPKEESASVRRMEGAPLDVLLERARESGRWPLEEPIASAIISQLLDEVARAHAQTPPVFHRDLSPSRLRMSGGSVTLAPFGTPHASGGYMSPEQAHGQVLEARSDVFTAGALLFELVCGRLPAQGVSALALGELDSA